MGNIIKDDFLYGCHSGIQKAIRRSDLALGKMCFDALWGNKTHRSWLKWRLPILTLEESSHLVGEMVEFVGGRPEESSEYWKFIKGLILTFKNNDGTGILRMARMNSPIKHREVEFFKPFFKKAENGENLGEVANELKTACFSHRKFSKYEERAINFLARRSTMGGMLGDRQNCLSNMVFIAFRGLPEKEIKTIFSSNQNKKIKKSDLAVKELPWFIFDMHTVVGKIVLSIAERKYCSKWGISVEQLSKIWFMFSSGHIPRESMNYISIKPNPTVFENVWQVPSIKGMMSIPKIGDAVGVKKLWEKTISPKMQKLVEDLLQERIQTSKEGN